ncbi:MAG TPA: hypothetical protein VJ302_04525 [Blastocatellia bacterium]|nr:hypothetical protein [Blastocatellia bacterium]
MDTSIKTQLPADKTLTGVFTDRTSAERAYQHLLAGGYNEDDITVLMSDEARIRYFPAPGLKGEVVGDTVREGPGLGAVVGAGAGTALGAIIGAAVSLAMPGVGLIIAGPLAATLTGATLGGLSGGLLGSLLGIGIPEHKAKHYEEQLKAGNILIGVNPHSPDDEQQITEEWRKAGVEIIHQ